VGALIRSPRGCVLSSWVQHRCAGSRQIDVPNIGRRSAAPRPIRRSARAPFPGSHRLATMRDPRWTADSHWAASGSCQWRANGDTERTSTTRAGRVSESGGLRSADTEDAQATGLTSRHARSLPRRLGLASRHPPSGTPLPPRSSSAPPSFDPAACRLRSNQERPGPWQPDRSSFPPFGRAVYVGAPGLLVGGTSVCGRHEPTP
jgi:hypothetical protein